MTNQVMPKWKINTIEAAIQVLQRDKVPITPSRIRKRTGPSVTLDEIPAPRRGGMSGATHS